ncbi:MULTISPECIES: hypothetical protein [Saliphagus]|uniref:DUF5666 domain-containing protein n=1 Tax=Saliphagus infecundisoli TaxID=1849069 RepID=A0ABD5QLM0_9EURY|nr:MULTISPECIES: hypothetical protein [Saliphagus]
MSAREPAGQAGRLLAAALLLVALAALLVWSGTLSPDPAANRYPEEEDVMPNPGSHVGERASVGGYVVGTDPVVIESGYSGPSRFTLEGAMAAEGNVDSLETGDRVTAFGTITDESTIETERLVTGTARSQAYMFVVSAVGGLWVAGRFLWGWRFDLATLSFVPRGGDG